MCGRMGPRALPGQAGEDEGGGGYAWHGGGEQNHYVKPQVRPGAAVRAAHPGSWADGLALSAWRTWLIDNHILVCAD